MKIAKFGFGKAKGLQLHYERNKEDDGTIKDTSFSKINPAKSHLNYNLCDGDLVELLEQKKQEAYVRSEKTDVAFLDLCITYPKDCSVSEKEFFKNVYDILTKDRVFKNCIGAFVHLDETSPHMHYIFMPLEKGEFTKSKDIKVFDEKKNKEVKRRIKTTYSEKFNAKKLITKNLLNNLHQYMQNKINERGISATIITPERVAFNNWKKERIEHYNKLIEQAPDKKLDYINAFWEEYQKMNPRDYKKNTRAKDSRLEQFNIMLKEYEEQQKEEFEQAKKEINQKYDTDIADYRKLKNEELDTQKNEIDEKATNIIHKYIDDINDVIEEEKKNSLEKAKKMHSEIFDRNNLDDILQGFEDFEIV